MGLDRGSYPMALSYVGLGATFPTVRVDSVLLHSRNGRQFAVGVFDVKGLAATDDGRTVAKKRRADSCWFSMEPCLDDRVQPCLDDRECGYDGGNRSYRLNKSQEDNDDGKPQH